MVKWYHICFACERPWAQIPVCPLHSTCTSNLALPWPLCVHHPYLANIHKSTGRHRVPARDESLWPCGTYFHNNTSKMCPRSVPGDATHAQCGWSPPPTSSICVQTWWQFACGRHRSSLTNGTARHTTIHLPQASVGSVKEPEC